MLALMVFLAVAVLAFGLMAAVHARSSVKRRAAGIAEYSRRARRDDKNSLRGSSVQGGAAPARLHHQALFDGRQGGDAKVLRRRLIQAGIFDSRAVAFFFVARTVLAVGLACRRVRRSCRCS